MSVEMIRFKPDLPRRLDSASIAAQAASTSWIESDRGSKHIAAPLYEQVQKIVFGPSGFLCHSPPQCSGVSTERLSTSMMKTIML
jgi:hypothetical protein